MEKKIYLGINSDKDFCMCCGKQDLKKVMWIEDESTGIVEHYGTTCGIKMLSTDDKKKRKKGLSILSKLELYESRGRIDLIHGFKTIIKESKLTKYIEILKNYEIEKHGWSWGWN